MAKSKNRKSTEIPEDADGREKALARTLGEIDKRFGAEAIRKMGDNVVSMVPAISTGSLSLDAAIGIGGIPKGRIVEFYGPESSGKTTLALHAIASAQKTGGVAAFIDAEHALDPAYARKLGVNLDDLLVSQPDSGEQALEIAELLTRSGAVDIIVIDSVAALTPQAELDGEMGDSHVGLQARLMSQGLRKLTGIAKKSNTTVVFINQIRMKIGVMFGSPETTTGGNALKFYASLRLDIRRTGTIKDVKDDDNPIGNNIKVKVVKNKVAPPFKIANFDIMFNQGINYPGELIDLGVNHDIVNKSGAWFSYGQTRLGQGRDKACQFLVENQDIYQEIEKKLHLILFPTLHEDDNTARNQETANESATAADTETATAEATVE